MIIDRADLAKVRKENAGQQIVLAAGTFDLLHAGHIDYLEWARSLGGVWW